MTWLVALLLKVELLEHYRVKDMPRIRKFHGQLNLVADNQLIGFENVHPRPNLRAQLRFDICAQQLSLPPSLLFPLHHHLCSGVKLIAFRSWARTVGSLELATPSLMKLWCLMNSPLRSQILWNAQTVSQNPDAIDQQIERGVTSSPHANSTSQSTLHLEQHSVVMNSADSTYDGSSTLTVSSPDETYQFDGGSSNLTRLEYMLSMQSIIVKLESDFTQTLHDHWCRICATRATAYNRNF